MIPGWLNFVAWFAPGGFFGHVYYMVRANKKRIDEIECALASHLKLMTKIKDSHEQINVLAATLLKVVQKTTANIGVPDDD